MQVAAVLAQKEEHHAEEETPAIGSCFKNLVSVLKRARQLEQQAEALDEEFRMKEEELTNAILNAVEESVDIQHYIDATTGLRKQQEHLVNMF